MVQVPLKLINRVMGKCLVLGATINTLCTLMFLTLKITLERSGDQNTLALPPLQHTYSNLMFGF